MIRSVQAADAARIAVIYNHYVRESVVTFEEEPVAEAEMSRRIAETTAFYPWFVWEQDGVIVAYANASSWKRRSAYRLAAESTIYVAPESTGQGIGTQLYPVLIAEMRARGLHAAIGRFREVGCKFGRWIDVGYWELILQ